MATKVLALSALCLILVAGCAEKKTDPAKIDAAAKLITGKQFEKGIAILDGLARSSPNNEVLKKSLVDAHLQYGNYFMYESTSPPREKYPSALRQYKIVADLDPKNTEARQNISLIEGIYNQMGRTVPN